MKEKILNVMCNIHNFAIDNCDEMGKEKYEYLMEQAQVLASILDEVVELQKNNIN